MLALLAAGVIGALVVVGVVGTLAARQLAEREAVNDAATMADVLAKAVVEPALTDGLLKGDPAAIAAFDQVVKSQLLTRTGPDLEGQDVERAGQGALRRREPAHRPDLSTR